MPTDEEKLKKVYYSDGNLVGRDLLFDLMKRKYPKSHPSVDFISEWLKAQETNQVFLPTRKSRTTDRFKPTNPWENCSMDLIDYSGQRAKGMAYVLVFVDNFSRFMLAVAMKDKSAITTSKALATILRTVERDHKPHVIKSLITDDGGEFKGPTDQLLTSKNIKVTRALGGQPFQNGLVERANGKVKKIIGKLIFVNKKNWYVHLDDAVKIYNNQFNRGIGMSAVQALKLKPWEYPKLREHNKKAYGKKETVVVNTEAKFKIGDNVRRKLNKSVLGKSSKPSWSSDIYKVVAIVQKDGVNATKYKIDWKKGEDKLFTRTDLLIANRIEVAPEIVVPQTRSQIKKIPENRRVTRAIGNQEQRRSTRTVKEEPKQIEPVLAKPVKKKTVQKLLFKVGNKVNVKYPDAVYPGKVTSITDEKIRVEFVDASGKKEFADIKKSKWNLITKR